MATKKQRAGTDIDLTDTDLPDIDLKPWAAYVVGHSPHSLGIWCERLLHAFDTDSFDAQEASVGSFTTETRELKKALRALASGEQVRGAVLDELLDTLTRLEGTFRELAESPEMVDPEAPCWTGYSEWQHVVDLSARCVGPSEELQLWRKLGEAVGRSQYRLWVDPELDRDFVPAEVGAIPAILRGLRRVARKALVQEIRQTIKEVNEPAKRRTFEGRWSRVQARYAALSELDGRLRSALRERAAPEWLVALTEKTIGLLGVSRPLKDFPESRMACLRVLAEHGCKPVEREVIIEEGGIETDPYNLRWIVHRLDEDLKQWGREICKARGCDEPECVKSGFITGLRETRYAKHGTGGPYRLAVDRSRVRVDGPRPSWMPTLSEE
jgi:hypothetical protein